MDKPPSTPHFFFLSSLRYYNLQIVKAKRDTKASAKAKQQAQEDEEAQMDAGNVSDGSVEDQEADAFFAKAEGMADDGLGDPDGGYDYDSLMAAMADGKSAALDEDEDEEDGE